MDHPVLSIFRKYTKLKKKKQSEEIKQRGLVFYILYVRSVLTWPWLHDTKNIFWRNTPQVSIDQHNRTQQDQH